MKVFSTAAVVGQAFKNAGRVKEIVSVFVRYGFAEVIQRIKLSGFVPAKASENPSSKHLPTEKRLRLAFEELGPTFVKFGQLLASRPDLLPQHVVEEFQVLQDNVKALPYEVIESHLEEQLKVSMGTVFESFEEQPLAAASIAQVHGAILQSGERVAVKVQRPGIDRVVQNDISILRGLAELLERYVPETRLFNPRGMVEEFFYSMQQELDFHVESNNIRKIKKNLEDLKNIRIPTVYSQWCTGKVLILERIEGIRVSDREAILAANINPSDLVESGCDAFFHMVLEDGIFHGDLHAGNLFAQPGGAIGIVDFGIVGRLSKRIKESVTTMFIAIMDEDYESLASEYVYLSQSTGETDINLLQKDLMDLISPYIGMAIGDVNIGHILMKSTSVAARHHLRVPRELMLLFKAIVTIEGLGKKLDPSFDLLQVGTRLARQALSARYSREQILKDLVVVGRDLQQLIEIVPRLSKRFLRKWSQNGFAFETRSKDVVRLARAVEVLGLAAVQSAFGLALYALGIFLWSHDTGPALLNIPTAGPVAILAGTIVFISAGLSLRGRINKEK